MRGTAGCRLPGSIPACAGEPMRRSPDRVCGRVYPRVCGGTCMNLLKMLSPSGLSPRVRGNPKALAVCLLAKGSIPACAGEPG